MAIRAPRIPVKTREGIKLISLNEFLQAGKDLIHINKLDPTFSKNLEAMLRAAPPNVRAEIFSGYRSPERQKELYEAAVKKYGSEAAARRWVAPPGHSFHNKGFAADLKFASPVARKWVHENAAKYGLYFPLSNEPWHIEQIGTRSGKITSQTSNVIRRGSSPEAVKALQGALTNAGFDPGAADGKFGRKTEAAVRNYQFANGLKVDGVVGPQTQQALNYQQGTRGALAYGNNYRQDPWASVASRTQLPTDPRASLTPGRLPAAQFQTKVAGDPRASMTSQLPAARQQQAPQRPASARTPSTAYPSMEESYRRIESFRETERANARTAQPARQPTYNMVRPAPSPMSLPQARQTINVTPKSTPKPLISPQEQIAYNASTYGARPQTLTQRVAETFGPRLPKPMVTEAERQTIPVTPRPVTTQSFPGLQQFPGMPPAPAAPAVPAPTLAPPQAPGQGLVEGLWNSLPSLSTVKQGIQNAGKQVINQAVKTYLGSGPVKLAEIAGQSGGPGAFWNQINTNQGSPVNVAAASYQAAKMFMNPKSQQAYQQPRNTQGKFTSGNQGNYSGNRNTGGNYRGGEGSRYSGPGSGGYTNRSGGA